MSWCNEICADVLLLLLNVMSDAQKYRLSCGCMRVVLVVITSGEKCTHVVWCVAVKWVDVSTVCIELSLMWLGDM